MHENRVKSDVIHKHKFKVNFNFQVKFHPQIIEETEFVLIRKPLKTARPL